MAGWTERDEQGQGGSIEYTFTCNTSRAGFTEYNEGKTVLLILEGEAEFSNGKVIDKHLWIGAPSGKGWSATDDGSFFTNLEDPEARFGRNSKIQKFISSALKAGVPLKEKGENSLDARAWAGSKFRVREEDVTFTPQDTGEERTYQQPLVVEYLGEVGTGSTKPSTSSRTSASGASAANGDSGDKVAKATLIAKKHAEGEDLVSYMDEVSRTLGVALDDEVCSAAFFKEAIKS